MKRAISLVKKVGRFYFNNWAQIYGPIIKAGVNPCL